MKTRILATTVTGLLFLAGCNSSGSSESVDQTDPRSVVEQVFKAAQSEDFNLVANLCDPEGEGDGDTKQICDIENSSADMQEEFVTYFKEGKVIGEPGINGNEAQVNIKFGPGGAKDETMKLIKRGDNWYLLSF